MNRATSRQRLHSDDEFAATINHMIDSDNDSSSDDEEPPNLWHDELTTLRCGRVSSFASDLGSFFESKHKIGLMNDYEHMIVQDCGYFIDDLEEMILADPEAVCLNDVVDNANNNSNSNSKKRDRELSSSKLSSSTSQGDLSTMKKSVSYTCLTSGLGMPMVPYQPKPKELTRTASMTRMHLSNESNGIKTLPSDQTTTTASATKLTTIPGRIISSRVYTGENATPSYMAMSDDIKLLILDYLDESDLRVLMMTSFENLALCRSEHLWLKFCGNQWKLLKHLWEQSQEQRQQDDDNEVDKSQSFYEFYKNQVIVHDDMRIRLIPNLSWRTQKEREEEHPHQPLEHVDWDEISPNDVNLSVLLQLTQPYPVKVDESFLSTLPTSTDDESNSSLAASSHRHNSDSDNDEDDETNEPEFRSFSMTATTNAFPQKRDFSVIQFTSTVGTSDRCIRSDMPFPVYQLMKTRRFPHLDIFGHRSRAKGKSKSGKSTSSSSIKKSSWSHHGSPFQDIFKRGKKMLSIHTVKPFVSPIVTKVEDIDNQQRRQNINNGRKEQIYTISLTPTLLAYFEVTLVKRDEAQEPSALNLRRNTQPRNDIFPNFQPSVSSDCVAIGLSTKSFDISNKMPGWDRFSYGYHGDDGGLFHAGGIMVRRYGPTFGVGDTVGCGIEYTNKGVFFTLNGKFLGYGWTGIDLSEELYPTVGVDTHHPVEVNFGSRPFAYDTRPFSAHHYPLIGYSLRDLTVSSAKAL